MHGVWLTRVGELRGFADASHCRVIAENGQGVTWTCQHHFYTGCSSPAIVNAVTNRMWSRNFRLMRLYTSPPQLCCVESLAIAFAVRRFRRSPFFAIRSMPSSDGRQQPHGRPADQTHPTTWDDEPARKWANSQRKKPGRSRSQLVTTGCGTGGGHISRCLYCGEANHISFHGRRISSRSKWRTYKHLGSMRTSPR